MNRNWTCENDELQRESVVDELQCIQQNILMDQGLWDEFIWIVSKLDKTIKEIGGEGSNCRKYIYIKLSLLVNESHKSPYKHLLN